VRTKSRLNSYLSQRDEDKPKPSGRHPKLRKVGPCKKARRQANPLERGGTLSSHQGLLLFLPDRPFRLGHVEIYFCICSNQALVQFNNATNEQAPLGRSRAYFLRCSDRRGFGGVKPCCFLSTQFTPDRTRPATRPVKDLTPSTLYCSSPSRAPSPLWGHGSQVGATQSDQQAGVSRSTVRSGLAQHRWRPRSRLRGRLLPEQRGLPVRRAFDHHNTAPVIRKGSGLDY
jgi:hypothetical protein